MRLCERTVRLEALADPANSTVAPDVSPPRMAWEGDLAAGALAGVAPPAVDELLFPNGGSDSSPSLSAVPRRVRRPCAGGAPRGSDVVARHPAPGGRFDRFLNKHVHPNR